MAKKGPQLIDPRLATAIEHPVRIEILSSLREEPSSAARIQRQLDNISLNLVSHHMKVLKDLGCIELVETVNRRGAREHIFRIAGPMIVSDEEFAELTPRSRSKLTASVLRTISQDLSESLVSGKFDSRPDSHLSRSPLTLDRQGSEELTEVLRRTLDEVIEIGKNSLERLAESDEEPDWTTVAILKFSTDGQ